MVKDWIEQYRQLSGRFETMKKALELLKERNGWRIVETGTTRMKDDWGAGMSTFIFGSYCKEFGGHVSTVDISPQNMDVCREVTKEYSEFIDYVEGDSLTYLSQYALPIDLLYLDSVDCPIEIKTPEDSKELYFAQNHQLSEITLGLPKLSKEGIVLLDDNAFEHGGKTALSKQYLKDQGWNEILSGQQSLWTR